MRLQQYIIESSKISNFDIFNIISLIYKESQPFIKEWIKSKNMPLMYRGLKKVPTSHILSVRKDRQPSDTPPQIHKKIDDAFYKKFGIRYRSNAIFCTGAYSSTKYYGIPYAIFPIGKYNFVYNPKVRDLYIDIGTKIYGSTQNTPLDDYSYDEIFDYYHDEIMNIIKELAETFYIKHKKDIKMPFDMWVLNNHDRLIHQYRDESITIYKSLENKAINEYIEKYIKGCKSNKDVSIIKAINSNKEIMVNTKKYIAINGSDLSYVIYYFEHYGNNKPTIEIIDKIIGVNHKNESLY